MTRNPAQGVALPPTATATVQGGPVRVGLVQDGPERVGPAQGPCRAHRFAA
ncbi:hypothetical protein GA0115240_11982 [Streptomyces sp. DvalAA-14]|uniref:hypothetical protein n=1 Tax=unclassified Streptomyces TaxID=2593676 RepID=UPI00081B8A65|nr:MULTISPECIES: hypothetical protein [unclassified Streptomyces]MYS20459.1 hypothetical protein [Streptomyces sp. SID4948]SCD69404.1 hypothetical protein GA0115240_11982 [Streptomyces sp. DvalAA-14]